jgi:CheY-like chemotaxis protein
MNEKAGAPLDGTTVIVVEDEAVVAMLIEEMLEELSCKVVGVAHDVLSAVELVKSTPADVAVLDANLAGERADPVAQALNDAKTPFVVASGYGESGITQAWRGSSVLPKPFRLSELQQALMKATGKG